jgi:hypothetical protein
LEPGVLRLAGHLQLGASGGDGQIILANKKFDFTIEFYTDLGDRAKEERRQTEDVGTAPDHGANAKIILRQFQSPLLLEVAVSPLRIAQARLADSDILRRASSEAFWQRISSGNFNRASDILRRVSAERFMPRRIRPRDQYLEQNVIIHVTRTTQSFFLFLTY